MCYSTYFDRLTILDGHMTIETIEGIFVVPIWFFSGARVAGVICIINEPLVIERRYKKQGFVPRDSVEKLQAAEMQAAKDRARELQIGYHEVVAADLHGFGAAVDSILEHS
jgi:adenylate kinase